ncbi:hypothetical protein HDU96_010897 [Phlyctochytrium bullatum]|nr:hypothetical protein HDU96_010897 [Phlyctochytrium bullatum]
MADPIVPVAASPLIPDASASPIPAAPASTQSASFGLTVGGSIAAVALVVGIAAVVAGLLYRRRTQQRSLEDPPTLPPMTLVTVTHATAPRPTAPISPSTFSTRLTKASWAARPITPIPQPMSTGFKTKHHTSRPADHHLPAWKRLSGGEQAHLAAGSRTSIRSLEDLKAAAASVRGPRVPAAAFAGARPTPALETVLASPAAKGFEEDLDIAPPQEETVIPIDMGALDEVDLRGSPEPWTPSVRTWRG